MTPIPASLKFSAPPSGFIVAILGAESTGKSVLAATLCQRLNEDGPRCTMVSEYLRTFCDRHHRTPVKDEQAGIADHQTTLIAQAAATHDIVLADTTALMTAVYSDMVFTDTSLYAQALQAHRSTHLTLLTALDLPWQADGLQRDGPHVREPVDRKIRAALNGASIPFRIVVGQDDERAAGALRVIQQAYRRHHCPRAAIGGATRWRHLCARCGDPDCERHLFGAREAPTNR